MPNALKKSFLENTEHPENPLDSPAPQRFLKSKRNLIWIAPVLLMAVLLKGWPDKAEKPVVQTTAVTVDVQNPAAPPPPKNEQAQPQPKPPKTPIEAQPIDLSFKQDQEYLSLNRYEPPYPPITESQPKTVPAQSDIREALTGADKPLVLAGKGFDIQGFQSLTKEPMHVDFLQRLHRRDQGNVEEKPREQLDLALHQVKSSKSLIFHPTQPALSKLPPLPSEMNRETEIEKFEDMDEIPETHLHTQENKENLLILRPGSSSLNLLTGNEKLNKKQFGNW